MSHWDGKSIGTLTGYKIFLFSIKFFGVDFAYLLLRVVAFYYFLFAKVQKNIMIDFYTKALNYTRKEALQKSTINFYKFGQTLIDRFAFLVGKGNKFTFSFDHEDYLLEIQKNGRGGVLLSAHLGNWEIAGNLLRKRISSAINIVMLDAEVEEIKTFLTNSTGGSLFNIIPIKDDLSHVIKISNALSNNEFVVMHADRYMEGSRFIEMDFLGRKAKFPLGPFSIIAKFCVPVTFVYAIKKTNFHYEFSATKPIENKLSVEEIAKQYIEELENKIRLNPEQWFNYYNFFH